MVAKLLTLDSPAVDASGLSVRLARSGEEVAAAQRLRHEVFVAQMGARGGELTGAGREADRFDARCEHLLLLDARGEVAGTTRLTAGQGGFAAEEEFDLAPLRRSGLRLLEVGRTCLREDVRGGQGLHLLWRALAGLVAARGVEVLFGLASFPGTDPRPWRDSFAWLGRERSAPAGLRPRSRAPIPLDPGPEEPFDRRAAVLAMPALAKAYLRMGARVGEGAFRDEAFGCLDLCMVVEAAAIPDRARAIYAGGA